MDGRQAQVRRRGYGTRAKQRVGKLEEGIGSALEAALERAPEGVDGVEGLGRRVHGTPSCSHPSPMSIADADTQLFGLKHNSLLKKSLSGRSADQKRIQHRQTKAKTLQKEGL
jgi:hypothetical protein